MNEKMESALNKQINNELYSSYLYVAMAAWAEANKLKGAANWLKNQAREEMMHVEKLYAYINDRDGRVRLSAIDKPPSDWSNIETVFKEIQMHENEVTESIHGLVALAKEVKDHSSEVFLQWFVNEQVEEQAMVRGVLDQIALLGSAPGGLFLLDQELAKRQPPVAPAPATA